MSLTLKRRDAFKWPVTAELPTGNPHKLEKVSFVAEFKYLDRAALRDFILSGKPDDEVLGEVLIGIEGVKVEDGSPAPFEAAFAAIIDDIALCSATSKAFFEGATNASAKNSKPSPAR